MNVPFFYALLYDAKVIVLIQICCNNAKVVPFMMCFIIFFRQF